MISPFGVDHGDELSKREKDPTRGNKSFGSPAKTAAVVGIGATALMGRGRAAAWGEKIGARTVGHADWSAGRAVGMKNKNFKRLRTAYAGKLKSTGKELGRSEDTREVTGRTAMALGSSTAAGGLVYGRKRLTPKEKR